MSVAWSALVSCSAHETLITELARAEERAGTAVSSSVQTPAWRGQAQPGQTGHSGAGRGEPGNTRPVRWTIGTTSGW